MWTLLNVTLTNFTLLISWMQLGKCYKTINIIINDCHLFVHNANILPIRHLNLKRVSSYFTFTDIIDLPLCIFLLPVIKCTDVVPQVLLRINLTQPARAELVHEPRGIKHSSLLHTFCSALWPFGRTIDLLIQMYLLFPYVLSHSQTPRSIAHTRPAPIPESDEMKLLRERHVNSLQVVW